MSTLDLDVPGDKSIAHRAVMLGALADGTSRVGGVPASGDVTSTIAAMRALGAVITEEDGVLRIDGVGARSLAPPASPIDCGNSGTTARLLLGIGAALDGALTLTGDASLRGRPMGRVADPLRTAGAAIEYLERPDRLPLRIHGARLQSLTHRSSVASAQVKSAVLLAGLTAGVDAYVEEPAQSRDHTERMLRAMGAEVDSGAAVDGGHAVRLHAVRPLSPLSWDLPGDLSSAAFLLAAAVLGGGAHVRVGGVGVNPTRTGFLRVLARMGVPVALTAEREVAGEPVADLSAGPASLVATRIDGDEVPSLVDELPLVAVLAAHARGETVVSGAAELRVKESDRIAAMCANLRALGVAVEERPDGFAVRGSESPLEGSVQAFGDHRIAMAFDVLGVRPGSRIRVDDPAIAAVSFPGFAARLERIRAARRVVTGGGAP